MLVFVTPHQFMDGICRRLVGKIRQDAKAISLIKGMEVKPEGPSMISNLIAEKLGISCCVLMGANIANEVIEKIINYEWFIYVLFNGNWVLIWLKTSESRVCRLLWRSSVKQRLDTEITKWWLKIGFSYSTLITSWFQLWVQYILSIHMLLLAKLSRQSKTITAPKIVWMCMLVNSE